MQFFSTRDQNRKVTSSEAIAQGLSNEGGLFVPESFPQVDVKALCELDYPAMAAAVIKEYLTDYSQDFLTEAARKTYGDAFGGKAGYLAPVEGDTYALELWHGPTSAFKDMALQILPHLLSASLVKNQEDKTVCILVATSGDTGKAALEGCGDRGVLSHGWHQRDPASADGNAGGCQRGSLRGARQLRRCPDRCEEGLWR